jgi:hypothetical protein
MVKTKKAIWKVGFWTDRMISSLVTKVCVFTLEVVGVLRPHSNTHSSSATVAR